MNIVILGYTGLIGNNILENLFKKSDFNLICVGRDIEKKPYRSLRIKYYKWDFKTFKKSNLLFFKKANFIINCVGKTFKEDLYLEKINVIFLRNLVKYIINNKFKVRLIHLSSVAVYGGAKNYLGQKKIISENSPTIANDLYSKSKIDGDLIIKNQFKKDLNKNFSYTILRISNVFGGKKKTNLFNFLMFSLKFGFWINSFDDVIFNFINIKDVTQAVSLVIYKQKISKNKIYIVSDDCKQYKIFKIYENLFNKKIIKFYIPISLIKFLFNYLPLPKKIINFFLIISSRVSYSNIKIKKDLNFNFRFSILKKIKRFK